MLTASAAWVNRVWRALERLNCLARAEHKREVLRGSCPFSDVGSVALTGADSDRALG